ncbi:MAG: hypothetical protein AB7F59_11765 [Bdellovibrionales bacterium]
MKKFTTIFGLMVIISTVTTNVLAQSIKNSIDEQRYEVHTSSYAPHPLALRIRDGYNFAFCDSGDKLVSGGCDAVGVIQTSHPFFSEGKEGWRCISRSAEERKNEVGVFIICQKK